MQKLKVSSYLEKPELLASIEERENEAFYSETKHLLLNCDTITTAYIQRHLKVGYARSAYLLERLVAEGYISERQGTIPGKVLLK